MNTNTTNLPLPNTLAALIEKEAVNGGFPSPAEYIQFLVNAEQQRKAKAKVETLLLEALEEEGQPVTDEWWEQRLQAYRDRHSRKES